MIQDLSGSWCIKGTGESTLVMDLPVPLMHHDPEDLGSLIRMDSPVPLMHHDPDRSWITAPDGFTGSFDAPWSRQTLDHWSRSGSGSPQRNAAVANLRRGIGPFLLLFSGLYWAWVCWSLHNTSILFPVLVVLVASMTINPSSWNHEDSIQGKSYVIFLWKQVPPKMNHNLVTSLKACCLFVCLFVILAGVVPSRDTSNEEVVDVLYRVQAMRLADAPRPRNTTPGGGWCKCTCRYNAQLINRSLLTYSACTCR